jgi:hypothetical protein
MSFGRELVVLLTKPSMFGEFGAKMSLALHEPM